MYLHISSATLGVTVRRDKVACTCGASRICGGKKAAETEVSLCRGLVWDRARATINNSK